MCQNLFDGEHRINGDTKRLGDPEAEYAMWR